MGWEMGDGRWGRKEKRRESGGESKIALSFEL